MKVFKKTIVDKNGKEYIEIDKLKGNTIKGIYIDKYETEIIIQTKGDHEMIIDFCTSDSNPIIDFTVDGTRIDY